MRSIWKGSISFGLVMIPVKLYSATEQKDVSFHQVHRTDAGRIRYKRVCTIDGEEVAYSDIAKGFELPGGEIVVLTDEDFADLPLSTSRRIDVLQFVPLDQVDPIYFAKSYYLEPDGQGSKPYVLLRDALEGSGMVALVKVALRQRESLATLRARDGVFVLETMLWPDEVRTADFPFLEEDISVRPQELSMASSLIDTMAGDFDPDEFHDAYREALQAVIEAKVEGREVAQPTEAAPEPPATDLLAALRASVEAAKKGRTGSGEEAEKPAAKRTASKRTASKSTASKPAASKSTASKSTASKSAASKSTASRSAAAKSSASKSAASKSGASKSAAASKSTASKSTASKRPRKSA